MTELHLSGITNTHQVEKTAVTTGCKCKTHLLISLQKTRSYASTCTPHTQPPDLQIFY